MLKMKFQQTTKRIVLLTISFFVFFLIGCGKEQKFMSRSDSDFFEESEVAGSNDEEGILVETSFVKLYYPSKWKNNIRVEQVIKNEVTSSVKFFGKNRDKEEQLLFVIHFNEDGEIPIGIIENNENIYINLTMAELKLDGLSQEEIDMISEMQESVNDILNQIRQIKSFEKIEF